MNEAQQQSDTSPAERPPLNVPRPSATRGSPWWVTGLRYPIERAGLPERLIVLVFSSRRFNVAGPFVSKAVAETAIAPSSRR